MTVIIGYVSKEKVYIAGDSAGISGNSILIRKDPKVFKNGEFIMGFTTSFRMGQLLMSSKLKVSKQKKSETDYHFMITTFIDAIIACFKDGGYIQKENESLIGGTFLVGYKGKLYNISSDFQVGETEDNFDAVGCGDDIARGAMYILEKHTSLQPEEKLKLALEAVNRFSTGVAPPFNIVSLKNKN